MKLNDALQWAGALFIIAGHILNSVGAEFHRDFWNILAFVLGTIAFLTWSLRVWNKPQMAVNVVAITVCSAGLIKSLG